MIDKLAWIHIQDKHILSTKSFGKDKYYIPGGKREPGETDAAALYREIREELSIELDVNTLQLLGTFRAQAEPPYWHADANGMLYRRLYRHPKSRRRNRGNCVAHLYRYRQDICSGYDHF